MFRFLNQVFIAMLTFNESLAEMSQNDLYKMSHVLPDQHLLI